MKINQANILKIAAVAIAIPRYAGAFALSAGFIAEGYLHAGLGVAEVVAGIAMAVLEGFALSFILSKWRLLKVGSLGWYALLSVCLLLALSLPLVAVPYLYFMQAGFQAVNDIFPAIWLQNGWNFIVAFVPMLVVIGVGLADVNELEREQRQIDFELDVSKKRAKLEIELSQLELNVERAKVLHEIEKRQLRAQHEIDVSNIKANKEQKVSKAHICEHCGDAFEKQRQLNGHLAHCKVRSNGHRVESIEVTA